MLVVGGAGASASSAEIFNGGWSQTGQPIVDHAFHGAALVGNQQVLVAGGRTTQCFVFGLFCASTATSELFDPPSGQFHVTSDLGTPRSFHVLTSLANKSVLATGGFRVTNTATLISAEVRDRVNDQVTALAPRFGGAGYSETSVAALLRCERAAPPSSFGGSPQPCGRLLTNLVVAYNDQSGVGVGIGGWSVFDPATGWEQHKQDSAGDSWGLPPEGTTDGSTFFEAAGDPSVVATGWPGQVAYIAMGHSVKNNFGTGTPSAVDVIMGVSTDGGHSFGTQSLGVRSDGGVSQGSFHILTDSDTGVGIDQPKAASDTGSHVVYVWWRQYNHHSGLKCTGVDGHCSDATWVKRIHFNADGSFEQELNEAPVDLHAVRIATDCSNRNDNCAGGTERVWLTSPDPDDEDPSTIGHGCPNTDTDIVHWSIAESGNHGQDWQTEEIAVDETWPFCVTQSTVPSSRAASNGENRSSAPIVFDKITQQRIVAITHSQHQPPVGSGDNIGTRLWVYFGPNGDPIPWHAIEVSPICPAFSDSCQGKELFGEQFGPSLAVQPGANSSFVAAAWHDARVQPFDPVQPPVSMRSATLFIQPGGFGDWQRSLLSLPTDGPSANNIPWIQTDSSGNTAWGDYEGMAALPFEHARFYATWGDNRLPGNSQVFGSFILAQ